MGRIIPSVKGTVDFYPEEMSRRIWLYDTIRSVAEKYGYQEYEAPILETLELYAAKSGEELVKKQSFVFEDRGGKQVAMRPELTPSLARMVAQRQNQLTYPLRWWSFGPFWRYERPQKGRTREFFQWNIDLIGVESAEVDAEIATAGAELLEAVGLLPTDAQILVNNRQLMEQELGKIGLDDEYLLPVTRLIDRRDKLPPEKWTEQALEAGLTAGQLDELKGLLADSEMWTRNDDLKRFFDATDALGKNDYMTFEPHIVRGLDYYTGTVMESRDTARKFRAIFGGGRYDSLVSDVGGSALPACGFAMGDKVIMALLEHLGKLPEPRELRGDTVLVSVFGPDTLGASLKLAAELREAGFRVASYPEAAKLGKQFKYADKIGAAAALVLGPDEIASTQVAVKDLRSGQQTTVDRGNLGNFLKTLIS
jgi:histidyl-tRNA synthetase